MKINNLPQLDYFLTTAQEGDVAQIEFFAQPVKALQCLDRGASFEWEGRHVAPFRVRGDAVDLWRAASEARVATATQALPPKGIEVAARLARAYGHAWGTTPAAAAIIFGGDPAVYLPLAEREADPSGIVVSDAVRGEDPVNLCFSHRTTSGRLEWRITATQLRIEVHRPYGIAFAVEVDLEAEGFVRLETSVRLEKGEVDVHERHVDAALEALRASHLLWEEDPEWLELEAALWALVKPEPEANPEGEAVPTGLRRRPKPVVLDSGGEEAEA